MFRRFPVVLAICMAGLTRVEAGLDPYGGDMRLTGNNTSGFFRYEKIDGRYWLITPDNHVFFSIAPCLVQYQDSWGQSSLGLDYNAYYMGVLAKYNNSRNRWLDRFHERLVTIGNNSVAGFSQDTSGSGIKVPETFRVMGSHSTHTSLGGKSVGNERFPDVFDEPTWSTAVDNQARGLASYKNDPYRIGAFPDNEIDWSNSRNPNEHLATAFFEAVGKPGKEHMVRNFLMHRYGENLSALNAAWGTAYTSWDGPEATSVLKSSLIPADNPALPAIRADKVAFVRVVADKYFSSTSEAARRYDPNHLVFSNRYALFGGAFEPQWDDYNRQIWESAGQYCDVIAINSYQLPKEIEPAFGFFEKVFQAARKPIMITEWGRAGSGALNPPGYVHIWLPNSAERANFATETAYDYWFLKTQNDPNDGRSAYYIMSLHHFQLYDEPPLGRPDGENYNIGYMSVLDELFLTFARPMGDFYRQMYDVLIAGKSPVQPARPQITRPWDGERVYTIHPTLSWEPVAGVEGYEVLVSPANYFPEEHTLEYKNVATNSFEVPDELAQGKWFWCVRSVASGGIGGIYTQPTSFRIKTGTTLDAEASFRGESAAGWRFKGREELGGAGAVFGWVDDVTSSEGASSLGLAFAGYSYNHVADMANYEAIEASKPRASGSMAAAPASIGEVTGPFSGLPLEFEDDFGDGTAKSWVLSRGDWSVTAAKTYLQSNYWGFGQCSYLQAEIPHGEFHVDLKINLAHDSLSWAGLMVRQTNMTDRFTESGYLICIRRNGTVFLWNNVDLVVHEEQGVVANATDWNRLSVVTEGDRIDIYVNDVFWRSWTDPNRRFTNGYFCLVTGNTRTEFDNIKVYTETPIPIIPVFEGNDIYFEWGGGILDYSHADTLEFDVFPFRMANQKANFVPSSKYLQVRMTDLAGGEILNAAIDAEGAFPIEEWTRVSLPLGTVPRAEVHRFRFLMNTGNLLFPMDQRIRINVDNITPPQSVTPYPKPEFSTEPYTDDFTSEAPEGWFSRGGAWGNWKGKLYGFPLQRGPSLFLKNGSVCSEGLRMTAAMRILNKYDAGRGWVIFGVDPIARTFGYAGMNVLENSWEIGWYDGKDYRPRTIIPETLRTNRDYTLEVELTSSWIVLRVDGMNKATAQRGNLGNQGLYGFGMDYSQIAVSELATNRPITSGEEALIKVR